LAIWYSVAARKPASHKAQRPSTPHCGHGRVPTPPSKSENTSFLTQNRKEVIYTTTRNLKGITFPEHPFLRKTTETPGEKPKTSTTGTQEIKSLTKNNCRCINFNVK
jgi:hypothetical protein